MSWGICAGGFASLPTGNSVVILFSERPDTPTGGIAGEESVNQLHQTTHKRIKYAHEQLTKRNDKKKGFW